MNPLNALKVMSGNGLCSDIAAAHGRDETARNNQKKYCTLLETIEFDRYRRESVVNIVKYCGDIKYQRRKAKNQLLYRLQFELLL
jgi:hypothetical protein